DRVATRAADEQTAAAPAGQGVVAAPPDEDISLAVAGQRIVAGATRDILDASDAARDVAGLSGSQVDGDAGREERVIEPVAVAAETAAAAELEGVADDAARQVLDKGEGGRAVEIAGVGAAQVPDVRHIRAD